MLGNSAKCHLGGISWNSKGTNLTLQPAMININWRTDIRKKNTLDIHYSHIEFLPLPPAFTQNSFGEFGIRMGLNPG